MWKPGQIITIHGVVYRVKRSHPAGNNVCGQCALNEGTCRWPNRKRYSLPGTCYLERLSPIVKIVQ